MATTMRHMFTIVTVIVTAALSAATPMILLTNPQAKCMSVEAPADALLHIDYEAPDLVMHADLGEDAANIDPRSFRRFRTTITVAQNVERENHHGERNANKNRQYDKRARQERIVKDLDSKKGSIDYVTKQDGQVQICVQSMTASAKTPTPILLRVTEMPAGEESVGVPGPEKTTVDAMAQLDTQSQQKAKEHFSQMERTLKNLISKTDMILRQADFSKELEVEFHEQSIAMNKASQWWPIVQLCVLLITGFTQANHMVAFFRKHHIF